MILVVSPTGTCPVYRLAPLEYRFALDAASAFLGGKTGSVEIWNNLPALDEELEDRWGERASVSAAPNILWVEPLAGDWQTRLEGLAEARETKTLVIINSGFLAARLPERQGWPVPASFGQLRRFRQALKSCGFKSDRIFGVHTLASILLNQISHQIGRFGRPALADRLQFAARQSYCSRGWAAFATVDLLVVERKDR